MTAGATDPAPAFARATPADIPLLRQLAHRIWHACYPDLIRPEQIRYMLDTMYDPDRIRFELEAGTAWFLVRLHDEPVGYLACDADPDQPALDLDKLYLLPETHGRGLGQACLAFVLDHARARGATVIRLRVNRRNLRARRASERAGFRVTAEHAADIGNGFVMDDYLMERPVPPSAASR